MTRVSSLPAPSPSHPRNNTMPGLCRAAHQARPRRLLRRCPGLRMRAGLHAGGSGVCTCSYMRHSSGAVGSTQHHPVEIPLPGGALRLSHPAAGVHFDMLNVPLYIESAAACWSATG
eukprot:COSAG01_NODE_678_length_14293_cov_14.229388_6_plen_117_part_00